MNKKNLKKIFFPLKTGRYRFFNRNETASSPLNPMPRSVRSNGGQQNVNSGLFTDASPIFKFLLSSGSEDYGNNFAKPQSVSANDFENMIRYTYLNNYLGYNMLII